MNRFLFVMGLLLMPVVSVAAPKADYQDIQLHQFPDMQPIMVGDISVDKPTYLKLWATWCKPCMEQMSHFSKLHQQYGDQVDFISVNVNINESHSNVRDVIEQFSLKMPVLLDNEGQLGSALGLVGTPYSVLTNSDGEVVYTTHESDSNLDRIISMLAQGQKLPASKVEVISATKKQKILKPWAQGEHLLFFTATWCDWYLADTRPDMALACKQAQKDLNILAEKLPEQSWHGIVSHLWTDDKALSGFNQLYQMEVEFSIDTAGVLFNAYKISSIPTLLKIKDGEIIEKVTDFSNPEAVIKKLRASPARASLPALSQETEGGGENQGSLAISPNA